MGFLDECAAGFSSVCRSFRECMGLMCEFY